MVTDRRNGWSRRNKRKNEERFERWGEWKDNEEERLIRENDETGKISEELRDKRKKSKKK